MQDRSMYRMRDDCITLFIVSLTGALVNRLSTSNKARMPLFDLLDCNMLKNLLVKLMLYLLGKYGSINWLQVLVKELGFVKLWVLGLCVLYTPI